MLDEQQASQVVVDCIRAVSHVGTVSFNGTLDDADIFDATRVTNVITLIAHDAGIGVPSLHHRIADNFFLGVGPGTVVDDVVGIVRDKSVPVPQQPADELVKMLAEHLTLPRAARGSRKSARKGGARKAAKKPAKRGGKKSHK